MRSHAKVNISAKMRRDTLRTVDRALNGALEGGREHAAQALQRVVTVMYHTVEQNTCVIARGASDGGVRRGLRSGREDIGLITGTRASESKSRSSRSLEPTFSTRSVPIPARTQAHAERVGVRGWGRGATDCRR